LVGTCKVGGLLALEDAIDVAGCALALVEQIRPTRNQAAGSDVIAGKVDGG
jgi:hypothetical protein